MFYVYLHLRLDDGSVFYVGKGQRNRAWSEKSRNGWWRNVAEKHGYSVWVLEYFETDREALERESGLIAEYRKAGMSLVNLTTGGEYFKLSEESCRKISIAKLGKPKSIEERIEMSRRRQGKLPDEETKRKMSATRTGKFFARSFRPNLRLNQEVIASIFNDKRPSLEIQKEYGLSQGTVSRIRTGRKTT